MLTYPFIALYSGFFGYMKLIFDFLWPIKAIVSFILNSAFSLVWSIIILPYTILMFFYNGALEMLTVIKGLSSSFKSVQRIAKQAPTNTEAVEAFSMLAYAT